MQSTDLHLSRALNLLFLTGNRLSPLTQLFLVKRGGSPLLLPKVSWCVKMSDTSWGTAKIGETDSRKCSQQTCTCHEHSTYFFLTWNKLAPLTLLLWTKTVACLDHQLKNLPSESEMMELYFNEKVMPMREEASMFFLQQTEYLTNLAKALF